MSSSTCLTVYTSQDVNIISVLTTASYGHCIGYVMFFLFMLPQMHTSTLHQQKSNSWECSNILFFFHNKASAKSTKTILSLSLTHWPAVGPMLWVLKSSPVCKKNETSVLHKYLLQSEILMLVTVSGVAGDKQPVYQCTSQTNMKHGVERETVVIWKTKLSAKTYPEHS